MYPSSSQSNTRTPLDFAATGSLLTRPTPQPTVINGSAKPGKGLPTTIKFINTPLIFSIPPISPYTPHHAIITINLPSITTYHQTLKNYRKHFKFNHNPLMMSSIDLSLSATDSSTESTLQHGGNHSQSATSQSQHSMNSLEAR
ncbi:hypothetical protein PCANC_06523 [Puccinia coronata f. sp. avenae]|uniref:Uncharacterized protein n=1 Tax=Puccinia coronata f. sp. avenae TaxID=200324 RepID=A0A2N5VAI9_9BASI|nr:hypothetical protein PCANC_06037 [Puccinia coronata f. sp. avenae]PLW46984.1 hypothetical protein PCANC_06523 [Puccinia coronata f. sp. avenae]